MDASYAVGGSVALAATVIAGVVDVPIIAFLLFVLAIALFIKGARMS